MQHATLISRLNKLVTEGLINPGDRGAGIPAAWNLDQGFCIADILGEGKFDPSSYPGERLRDQLKLVVSLLNDTVNTRDTSDYAQDLKASAIVVLDQLKTSLDTYNAACNPTIDPATSNLSVNWTAVTSLVLANHVQTELQNKSLEVVIPHLEDLLTNPFYAIGMDPVVIRNKLRVQSKDKWIEENSGEVLRRLNKLEQELFGVLVPFENNNPNNPNTQLQQRVLGIRNQFTAIQAELSQAGLDASLDALVANQNLNTFSEIRSLLKRQDNIDLLTDDLKLLGITPDEFAQLRGNPAAQSTVLNDQFLIRVSSRIDDLYKLVRVHSGSPLGRPSEADILLLKGKLEQLGGKDKATRKDFLKISLVKLAKEVEKQFKTELTQYLVELNKALEPHSAARAKMESDGGFDLTNMLAPQSYREFLMLGENHNPDTPDRCAQVQQANYIHRMKCLNSEFLSAIADSIDLSSLQCNVLNSDKIKNVCEYQYQDVTVDADNHSIVRNGNPVGNVIDINGAPKLTSIVDKLKDIYDAAMVACVGPNGIDPIKADLCIPEAARPNMAESLKAYRKKQTDIDCDMFAKYGFDEGESLKFRERFNKLNPPWTRFFHKTKQAFLKAFSIPGYVTYFTRPLAKYGPYGVLIGAGAGILVAGAGLSLGFAVPAFYLMNAGMLAGLLGWTSSPLHKLFAKAAHSYQENEKKYMNARLGSYIRYAETSIQNPYELISVRAAYELDVLSYYFPHNKQFATDHFYFDAMHAREYGHNILQGNDNQNYVRDSTGRDLYEKIQDWMARGWGNLSKAQAEEIEELVKKRGIPRGYSSNGMPSDVVYGDTAWDLFVKRYGKYDDPKNKLRVLEPFPTPRETSNPLLKLAFAPVKYLYKRGDAIYRAADENLADFIVGMTGKQSGFFYQEMMNTMVKTSSKEVRGALSEGVGLFKKSLQLPQSTYGDGKTRHAFDLFAQIKSPYTCLLADTHS